MSRPVCRLMACLFAFCAVSPLLAADPLPKVVDPQLKIELFAEHPQIVTPTGIDVDPQGRVWAIESNTHFPPEGYKGHPTDRLLILHDENGDGRADDIKVFADGLVHSMSVAVRPAWYPIEAKKTAQGEMAAPKLSVYVATRKEILLLHDDDGDLKADRRERLVHLETKGDYPHNGLAGITFDALGNMFFGFGENLGADYKIIGSDGQSLSGGNEGGNIYRCRLDGSQLTHWATGFWNPHASCIDSNGQMFSVDNDPDSRPPCRLLHIIPNGDYGYRFRNGRKGLHPFTAWNGEIPGTLPMVAGTGEAPSGIIAYDSDGLPNEYRGTLLVGSWGDHRIDRFLLSPKGRSFTSLAQPVVIGNENFRPVGLAVAPDGSVYFTDWVLREYKLHSHGRIWRLSAKAPRDTPVVTIDTLRSKSLVDLYAALDSKVGSIRRMAAYLLGNSNEGIDLLITQLADRGQSTRSRLEAFWSAANIALKSDPSTKMLLALRSLAAARSLSASNSTALSGSRPPEPVASASMWLSGDSGLKHNPVIDNLLALSIPSSASLRGWPVDERGSSLARLAAEINDPISPDEVLPRRTPSERSGGFGVSNTISLADPFVLSLTVDRLSRVESLEQFRTWWEAWQTPDLATGRSGVGTGRPRFGEDGPRFEGEGPSGIVARVQVLRLDHMRHARTALVLAARRKFPRNVGLLKTFMNDSEPLVKRLALQWIAELKVNELRPEVEALLKDNSLDSDLFLTTLAALEMLDGKSPVEFDQTPAGKYVLPLVTKDGSPTIRRLALRLVSPNDPALTRDLFAQLLAQPDQALRLEAIRTLQLSSVSGTRELLDSVITNDSAPLTARAEAVVGLAVPAKVDSGSSPVRKLLDRLVLGDESNLRIEALRSLRGTSTTQPSAAIPQLAEKLRLNPEPATPASTELLEQLKLAWAEAKPPLIVDFTTIGRPTDVNGWYVLAGLPRSNFGREDLGGLPAGFTGGRERGVPRNTAADASAGRRTFFHINSAGCSKCHTIDGRGGKIGPDLTNIARTMDRAKLAQSILEPSREMSPQFVSWALELKSGKVLTGLILSEESEKLKIGTQDGQVQEVLQQDIESRASQAASLMPEKLIDQLTQQEFLDLLAFLETLK